MTPKGDSGVIRVAALSQGWAHFREGNPGDRANLDHLLGHARQSLADAPDLIVFPEFATTGKPYAYTVACADGAHATAERVPGPGYAYTQYTDLAREGRCAVCGWLVEVDEAGRFYNCCVLIDREGQLVGRYHKVHPTEGEQYIWGTTPGDTLPVFDLDGYRVGIQICLDMQFPEGCRALMLQGADLIVHATVSNDRRDICPVRCQENAIPMVISIYDTASYAIDAKGRIIDDLGNPDEGGYLVADIAISRRMTAKYGVHRDLREMYRFRRNPAAYTTLTDPSTTLDIEEIMCDASGTPLDEECLRRAFPRYDPPSDET